MRDQGHFSCKSAPNRSMVLRLMSSARIKCHHVRRLEMSVCPFPDEHVHGIVVTIIRSGVISPFPRQGRDDWSSCSVPSLYKVHPKREGTSLLSFHLLNTEGTVNRAFCNYLIAHLFNGEGSTQLRRLNIEGMKMSRTFHDKLSYQSGEEGAISGCDGQYVERANRPAAHEV
ncbi:hypothetical protein BJY00DRAFT_30705 [Aspergillus carlsbadensis]|nr:hypothetical protein BJY00DRAFT_30705 [Aspergillus carlsbadensis]